MFDLDYLVALHAVFLCSWMPVTAFPNPMQPISKKFHDRSSAGSKVTVRLLDSFDLPIPAQGMLEGLPAEGV
jgi:hypothetical protein